MPYVAALLPTIGVAFLFYYVMKYILEGDRRERLAQARWERAEHSGSTAAVPEAPEGREAAEGGAASEAHVSPGPASEAHVSPGPASEVHVSPGAAGESTTTPPSGSAE
ncbi:MAG TPA: hypothetical protein PKZ38_11195 [Dermatophilaceae bacterium]|nr:hypothetical protein [Dermatophilaceae bacterium]HRC00640.1 hypothetical protein [Dermatophilaceae bacterium]